MKGVHFILWKKLNGLFGQPSINTKWASQEKTKQTNKTFLSQSFLELRIFVHVVTPQGQEIPFFIF